MPWTATVGGGAQHGSCAPPRIDAPRAAREDVEPPPASYESRFADWHATASVRTRPPLDASIGRELVCFPTELAPIVHHPSVQALGPCVQREALMQHLFSYLTFTDRLEDEVVNRSARRLATRGASLGLSGAMRLDAYKIYCDEGYHSLFSADLMEQLATASAFVYDGGGGHPALSFFHAQRAALDAATRAWFELFFAIVSETLISASLLRIPRARAVLPAVRHLVADHAADEWRHHAFFAAVCRLAWPRMSVRERRLVGPLIPRCIHQFLAADTPALLAFLTRHLAPARAADVIAESYPPDLARAQARAAARASLRVFQQAGLFDDPRTADAFHEEGLDLPGE